MTEYHWYDNTGDLFRRLPDGKWQRWLSGQWRDSNFNWDRAVAGGVLVVDVHTPADLAMALELADFIDVEGRGGELDENGHPIFNDCGPGCLVCTADWLRAEVIITLRGER